MILALLAVAVLIALYAAHELRHAPSADDARQATERGRWMELNG